ncbi:hypothetical protein QRX50_25800 [Amycolatopsis carbonis]|uniref:Uncharacterized protein n=1 Tax=Amycolatopsis carbonis TaxID=715471 RepID=A0A9Y2I9N0_9PSEU|nr:hypothetical protein [Amycolatopsis sp. 2-15]WIX74976.1 hypothetical protein QRX50_25800 [Amycolatopsis sp. 2-15]
MKRISFARRSAGSGTRLVATLRGTVGSRKSPISTGPRERLLDVVIHGQDIALPLGLDR